MNRSTSLCCVYRNTFFLMFTYMSCQETMFLLVSFVPALRNNCNSSFFCYRFCRNNLEGTWSLARKRIKTCRMLRTERAIGQGRLGHSLAQNNRAPARIHHCWRWAWHLLDVILLRIIQVRVTNRSECWSDWNRAHNRGRSKRNIIPFVIFSGHAVHTPRSVL